MSGTLCSPRCWTYLCLVIIDKQIATYRMKIAPSLLQKIFICGANEIPVISFNGRNKNKFFFHQLIFSQLAGSVAMSTLSSREVSSICRAANDPSVFTITTTRAFSGLLLVDSAYLLVAAALWEKKGGMGTKSVNDP